MPREYQVVESEDGFDVVDDRTGEIAYTDPDYDMAYFMAGEMFCDDEAMISHEKGICYRCHGTKQIREIQQRDGVQTDHYSPCTFC